jgi:hypothetical protein
MAKWRVYSRKYANDYLQALTTIGEDARIEWEGSYYHVIAPNLPSAYQKPLRRLIQLVHFPPSLVTRQMLDQDLEQNGP